MSKTLPLYVWRLTQDILDDRRPNLHLKLCSLILAVDGEWSEWRDWEPCSRTCGTGTQQRVRSCTRPRPAFGGRDCVGNSRETKTCETRACPGKFMLWRGRVAQFTPMWPEFVSCWRHHFLVEFLFGSFHCSPSLTLPPNSIWKIQITIYEKHFNGWKLNQAIPAIIHSIDF